MQLKSEIEGLNLNPAYREGHPDFPLFQVFKRWDFRAVWEGEAVRVSAFELGGDVERWAVLCSRSDAGIHMESDSMEADVVDAFDAQKAIAIWATADLEG